MSRSYKKSPFIGYAESDKKYKQKIHRQERVAVRKLLKNGKFDMLNITLKPYNAWDSNKDGKYRFDMLKYRDIKLYKKYLRK